MTINKGDKLEGVIPFFMVPNIIFDEVDNLTEHEKITYLYFCRCCNNGKAAFPSFPTIAAKCNFSRHTAIRAVSGLLEKGFITKEKRPKGSSNLYRINLLTSSSREQLPNREVVADSNYPVAESNYPVVADSNSINNYLLYKEELKKESLPSQEGKKILNNIIEDLKNT